MDITIILYIIFACIAGVITGMSIEKIKRRYKAPWAGNVIVDLHRDAVDTIRIESPRNISHWKDYRYLTFSVVVEADKT